MIGFSENERMFLTFDLESEFVFGFALDIDCCALYTFGIRLKLAYSYLSIKLLSFEVSKESSLNNDWSWSRWIDLDDYSDIHFFSCT